MHSLPLFVIADIHRQICIDILNSALPYGKQAEFAETVGISRQWLHRIRQTALPSMPSSDLAKRIAIHLPVSKQTADAFLEHLEAWRKLQSDGIEIIKGIRTEQVVDQLVTELEFAHKIMAFSKDRVETHRQLQKIQAMGELLVQNLSYQLFPLQYVRACTLLSEIYLTVNRQLAGLYLAKLARHVIEHLDIKSFGDHSLTFLDYAINICRHEGLAYLQMGLGSNASHCFWKADSYIALHPNPECWIPFISLSRLDMLSKTPRFVLADAESLAVGIEKSCERAGYDSWDITIDEHLARVYMRYGNTKKAKRALMNLAHRTEISPAMGIRQQAMSYRTLARFAWITGDTATWQEAATTALTITKESGLNHSYTALLNEFNLRV